MTRSVPAGILIVLLAHSLALGQAGALPEIVSVPKSAAVLDRLLRLDLDFLADWRGRLYIVAPPRDVQLLESRGIPFRFETPAFAPAAPRPAVQGGPIGAYHTHGQLERDLLDLQARYPGLARVFDIGASLEGRPLYALKISDNVSLDEDEAETLILGCHHAREWISVEVPFLFGKHLLERYAADADVRRLVDLSEIWIVPMVNPDGHDYSVRVYRYWRKNRRDNGGGEFGVDLNRNYGYQWGFDSLGSSPNPSSEIFRGAGPFSEPETRAVRDFFLGRDFRALVSYHSFSQVILYPWGYTSSPTDREATLNAIAGRMAEEIRSVHGRAYAFGPAGQTLSVTNGDTTDWAFAVSGAPAFTIELPPIDELGGGFFNREEDIQPLFLENLPGLLFLLQWAVEDYAARPPDPVFDLRRLLVPRPGRPRR
jgi:hypothetical protein